LLNLGVRTLDGSLRREPFPVTEVQGGVRFRKEGVRAFMNA
jgi:hypothetical protein